MPSEAYGFHGTEPRPIKAKYRETEDATKRLPDLDETINIHQDPRVVRGSTYARSHATAMKMLLNNGGGALSSPTKPQVKQKKGVASLASQRAAMSALLYDPNKYGTSSTSSNQVAEELDLSKYLIAPTPIEGDSSLPWKVDSISQTDAFAERPLSPEYIPPKTGVDTGTQIYASDNLFDFDKEVQALLDVLVGKTLVQSRLEVEREWELIQITEAADAMKAEREEEAIVQAQIEKKSIRKAQEQEDRRIARRLEAQARFTARSKVSCVALAKQCWPDIVNGAFSSLLANGAWTPATTTEVSTIFIPWLVKNVATSVDKRGAAVRVVDALCEGTDSLCGTQGAHIFELQQKAAQARREKARALAAAEQAKAAAKIRIFLEGSAVGLDEGKIGPIEVLAGDTIANAERAVQRWLEKEGVVVETPPAGGYMGLWLDLKGVDMETATLLKLREKRGRVSIFSEILLGAA